MRCGVGLDLVCRLVSSRGLGVNDRLVRRGDQTDRRRRLRRSTACAPLTPSPRDASARDGDGVGNTTPLFSTNVPCPPQSWDTDGIAQAAFARCGAEILVAERPSCPEPPLPQRFRPLLRRPSSQLRASLYLSSLRTNAQPPCYRSSDPDAIGVVCARDNRCSTKNAPTVLARYATMTTE